MIYHYLEIKEAPKNQRTNFIPRISFIGGKAAPGYTSAKNIIKFINNI